MIKPLGDTRGPRIHTGDTPTNLPKAAYHVHEASGAVSYTLTFTPSHTLAKQFADTKLNRSLYRRSLKLALDWSVHRNLWRGQAIYIRSLFENNRNVTDPRLQRVRNIDLFPEIIQHKPCGPQAWKRAILT